MGLDCVYMSLYLDIPLYLPVPRNEIRCYDRECECEFRESYVAVCL